MAQYVEPMDIDSSVCDFDNKENAHNNVLPRTPCTEKGYEELDVSELNMKLRYSVTPASSPMSKSLTADNRNLDSVVDHFINNENANLTRSMNSTMTRSDSTVKSQKILPLQALPTDQFVDGNRNALRPLDATATIDSNVTVTVSGINEVDENVSLPSSSSSMTHSPEAISPTKDILKHDGGSPIMRGLKSVFSMFRPSQSPIPPTEHDTQAKPETLSPPVINSPESANSTPQVVLSSTPLAAPKTKEVLSKRTSPNRESIVFNDDLENELQWKEESTIFFSKEKIPIHKLFFQQSKPMDMPGSSNNFTEVIQQHIDGKLDCTLEYMDISYNDSSMQNKTLIETEVISNKNEANIATESDSEFLDCESFIKNESLAEYSFESPDVVKTENILVEDAHDDKNLNTTKESTNNTSSIKSTEISTETTTATVDDILIDAVSVTQVTDNPLKNQEILESRTFEECPSLTSNKPKSFEHHFVENIKTTIIKDNIIDSPSKSNTDVINKSLVDTIPTLENIVISSLSQIPLISDPRVLLFNIPQTDADEQQSQETVTSLDTLPSDIPLPDEDIEKSGTLSTDAFPQETSLAYDTSLAITVSEVNIIEPFDKTAVVNNDDKIVKLINDDQILSKYITIDEEGTKSEQNHVLISPTVDGQIQDIIVCIPDVENKIKEIPQFTEPMDVNEDINDVHSLPDSEQVGANSNIVVEQKVLDASSSISEVETISFKGKEIASALSTPTFEDVVYQQQQTELEPKVKKSKSEVPVVTVTEIVTQSLSPDYMLVEKDSEEKIIGTTADGNLEFASEKESLCPQTEVELPKSDKELVNQTLEVDIVVENKIFEAMDTKQALMDKSCTNELIKLSGDVINTTNEIVKIQEVELPESDKELVNQTLQVDIVVENKICEAIDTQQALMDMSCTNELIKSSGDVINTTNEIIKIQENQIIDSVDENQSCSLELNKSGTFDILLINNLIGENNTIVEKTSFDDNNVAERNTEDISNKNCEQISNEVQAAIISTPVTMELVTPDSANGNNCVFTIATNIEIAMDAAQIIQSDSNQKETSIKEEQPLNTQSNDITENIELKNVSTDEEILISESNSPFVSVSADLEQAPEVKHIEEVENHLVANTSPPSSPKIVSKGYNFNFDEIDDPFATKTKIRMSPPPEVSPNKSFDSIKIEETWKKEINRNRRKSQPVRKKSVPITKKINATFNSSSDSDFRTSKDQTSNIQATVIADEKDAHIIEDFSDFTASLDNNLETCEANTEILSEDASKLNMQENINTEIFLSENVSNVDKSTDITLNEENKYSVESVTALGEGKITSCSEQSIYYSAGASSIEGIESKNVFNLPEIDDAKFNPFATKSKIRQSPPPTLNVEVPCAIKSEMKTSPKVSVGNTQSTNSSINVSTPIKSDTDNSSEDKLDTVFDDKDSSVNISNTTCSSKATDDKDVTIREIHTEDEDTIEGPFLEADDLNLTDDKISDVDCENVDMMQFTDLPAQVIDENTEAGELFIDAEAFEFLLNQNKDNVVTDSGKESLFLKFDPLFAKRLSSDGVVAALRKVQKRQSTPKKISMTQKDATFVKKSPTAGPSTLNVTHDVNINVTNESNDDFNITVTKPMMVVTPAVNPVITPRNKTMTPPRVNRRSLTFTSPAIAVIDRLLSMSTNNSFSDHETTVNEVGREQNEADLALTQLREMLADKEINVYNLRTESKDLKDRLASLESQVKSLESISEERLKNINELNDKLSEKTKINKSMATVVEEYERTIASLIAETEQDKKRHAEERLQLIKERDEQTAHLTSMEVSFSDLHSKYEKSKQVILSFKANEESYRKSITEFEDNFAKMQTNYELLKQHATSKLNHANDELQKMNRAHEAEVLKLNAMIKRKELHITSLEETLLQKTKANEELTAICDELINKVG